MPKYRVSVTVEVARHIDIHARSATEAADLVNNYQVGTGVGDEEVEDSLVVQWVDRYTGETDEQGHPKWVATDYPADAPDSDGTSGQDRDNYTDDQDRENYTVEADDDDN